MPRPPRVDAPGAIHHLTSRGVRRERIFVDDTDREHFLRLVARAVARCEWICHAYCLMTNHYHLLVETPRPTLSVGMQSLNSRYAEWFNFVHALEGHVFERRFRNVLVESDWHLLELARYVVLNPVRAGLCAHPSEWRWSSYRATAGLAPAPDFLTTSWLLGQFGRDDARARAGYRAFVDDAPPRARGETGHVRGLTPDMAGVDAATEQEPRPERTWPGSDPGTRPEVALT